MQVIVIEDGRTFRVERKNVRKGQGRTLAEFSNRDGQGAERTRRYLRRKGHTSVGMKVVGEAKRQADLREIEALLGPADYYARGA